jgi:hypothetical protein
LTLKLLILLLVPVSLAHAGSFSLLADTMDLNVGTYRYLKFRVTPDQADSTVISGSFSTIPPETPVEFILLTEWNYRSGWVSRGEIDTLEVLHSGSGELSMPVPGFGDYVLVVSNRGNYDPVRIAADLRVEYAGTGVAYDSLPMGMTILITILAAALVVAAVVLTVRKLT